jgi:hypothetical protein
VSAIRFFQQALQSKMKYLLLIPLIVSLIMLTFFSAAYDEIVREKHAVKFDTVKRSLNYIVSVVDRFVEADDDWDAYDYGSVLTSVFEGIDEASAIRVLLLDQDLTPISGTFIDDLGTPFDLLGCDDFVEAVKEGHDRGELTVVVDDGDQPPYELHIYYKRIPTGDYNNKLIAVYGVSRYALFDNFATWLIWGTVGLVLMTVVLQIWMILFISKLSDAERVVRERSKKAGEKNATERLT